jgi:tRNA dimethylallyltransferase
MSNLARLVVILGPTASGKSTLAIALAERLGGEILACDSTQVYRRFDIGTAKVGLDEQRGIAHHLIDLVEPQEVFTAGDYRRRALVILDDLSRRQKIPILTAGTGLYLRALLEGLAEAPERSDRLREGLREKCRKGGPERLYRLLVRLDPEVAERIALRDTPKIIRAIEMRVLAGKSVGEIHRRGRQGLEGYAIAKIGLQPDRAKLYGRIDARVKTMVEQGWAEEVRRHIQGGVPPDSKPFQFIGYSELRRCIEGDLDQTLAIRRIQQATRNFAKRQLTWFRKEPNVHWLVGFGDDPAVISEALAIVQAPEK